MQGEEFKEHQAFKLMKWFHLHKTFCHNNVTRVNLFLSNKFATSNKSRSQNYLFIVLWLERFIIAVSKTDKLCLILPSTVLFINHFEALRQHIVTERHKLMHEFQKYYLEKCKVWRLGTCDERKCIITKLNHSSPVQCKENHKEGELLMTLK